IHAPANILLLGGVELALLARPARGANHVAALAARLGADLEFQGGASTEQERFLRRRGGGSVAPELPGDRAVQVAVAARIEAERRGAPIVVGVLAELHAGRRVRRRARRVGAFLRGGRSRFGLRGGRGGAADPLAFRWWWLGVGVGGAGQGDAQHQRQDRRGDS